MRTRNWLKALLSGVVLAAGGNALAQQSYTNPDVSPVSPSGMPPSPQGYPAPTYPVTPYPGFSGYTGDGSDGTAGFTGGGGENLYTPGMNAWPNVSPYYGPPYQQLQTENGFWFDKSKFGTRRPYFSVDGLYGRYKDAQNRLVGSSGIDPLYGVAAEESGNNSSTSTTTGPTTDLAPFHYSRPNMPSTNGGLRLTLGWDNPDDSGFVVSGFFLGEATATQKWAAEPLINISQVGQPLDLHDVLQIVGGVPIRDGVNTTVQSVVTPDGVVLQTQDGSVQKYDLLYEITHASQTNGANMGWYFTPWVDKGWMKVRPTVGARYMTIREYFQFHGLDSGLDYTTDSFKTTYMTVYAGTLRPVTTSTITADDPTDVANLSTYVTGRTQSYLAGPEAGFRVDFGGKRTHLFSQTKFGLLANHSTRSVSNINFFNQTGPLIVPPTTGLDTLSTAKASTTNISPMLEQSLQFRSPVLSYVPYINKIGFLDNAEFQVGYTFNLVGAVYRPESNIVYQGLPLQSQVGDEKNSFWTSTWNFGVEWQY